ncbi:LamB/YcsF family protein, partial [bacterium]|nr:LamB/YcsF family protein [bacterium]
MQNTLERKSVKNIDFNCDLAQSYGVYKNNNEFKLLDFVSSVNISCGYHAGDPISIKEALLKAKEKNLAIGAHIGFNDIQGFGYRPVDLKEDELEAMVIYQVG